ncbi:hypothetical protein NIES2135_64010 (plasmid) [Leptolyngbya boryana NIES-2135]|jgi:hypothetical protein|uniref:Uncharacterized protein n=1 Tax=Leptolyngbya boryana NIES-2135 TaxID=1973484 RepID=A0A1Z4JS38_LEPBY|nr:MULTISPECIES: hypothetical protein [Leptolyngbya]BAY59524.1 hypothetical protein NIES2135_64010 [Leptolyngbya boryana NIES-2135]MBD2371282.1 hypothetical protein [Leptolyngbya sp. FACHB-161]MBD2377760.1 hypothetical protein [Leptolyngbya sp. FACHB-238]MBD2402198.1 hypothetical protein [Leptolyngbya sp. FACHB-239]MBD2408691.1 hypothetical protein [Leptolyngbya sp. FACHB-402]
MVNPYPFKGGNISNYETFIGQAGTYNTRHIPTGESIPCVQPPHQAIDTVVQPSGLDMLPIANLALGVLNLGVGVYNASKLRKIGKKLDRNHEQIQSYFGSIQKALNGQQRTLEVLACNQYNLSQKMDILRQEMHSEFEHVVREIRDTEANRRRREYYANTHELLEVYERFVDHLPDLVEADRLIDRAERLESLVQAELNQITLGEPCRLPLVTALSFSVRAKVDAFEAKGGKYLDSADKAMQKLKAQICREAYALCHGHSLYFVGVQMPEIIYQYALLHRGVNKGLHLRCEPELDFAFYQDEIKWDDGLDEFRNLFDKAVINAVQDSERIIEKTKINLKTLADYDWYIRFANEDRLNFDIHSRQTIQLSEILKKIGHPTPVEGAIRKCDLNALMLFALPEAAQKFEDYVQDEFKWAERLQLAGSRDRKVLGD